MSKTYAETQGKEPFNWNEFLADENEPYRDDTAWERAKVLAMSWVTCAVGNQCSIIPRHWDSSYGCPIDEQLQQSGKLFYILISDKQVHAARLVLKNIEWRSAILIEEILKEQNNEKTNTTNSDSASL